MNLTIAGRNGKRQIRARRVGTWFAVHRAVGMDEMVGKFTVTHIPTGYRIAQAKDRETAIKAAKLMSVQLGARADFKTVQTWKRRWPLKERLALRKMLENIPGVAT